MFNFSRIFKKPVTYGAAESYAAYLRELAAYTEHWAKIINKHPQHSYHKNAFLCIAVEILRTQVPAAKQALYGHYGDMLLSEIKQAIRLQAEMDGEAAEDTTTLRYALTAKYGVPETCGPERLNKLRVRWLRDLAAYHAARGN